MACNFGDEIRYKCHNSTIWYKEMVTTALLDDYGKIIFDRMFDKKCENDDQSYQACGEDQYSETIKSYKNAICQLKVSISKDGSVKADLVEEKQNSTGEMMVLPSGVSIEKDLICNEFCDLGDCEDEAVCNGYTYGQYCHANESVSFIQPEFLCTKSHKETCCRGSSLITDSTSDPTDSMSNLTSSTFYPTRLTSYPTRSTSVPTIQTSDWTIDLLSNEIKKSYICNDISVCDPKTHQNPLSCDRKSRFWSPALFKKDYLYNRTRCFPRIQCWGNIDQTNCSDRARVGATCRVNGYISTVSKYLICPNKIAISREAPLCDDGFDQVCEKVSYHCFVHKHQLCDGIPHCESGIDETISICRSTTVVSCIRRGGNGTVSLPFPLAWLSDGIDDCMNGEDETAHIWPTCGIGQSKRFIRENKTCSNVFLCRTGNPGFVELQDFCDGKDTCGNENNVCRVARNGLSVMTEVIAELVDHGIQKSFSYCLQGL